MLVLASLGGSSSLILVFIFAMVAMQIVRRRQRMGRGGRGGPFGGGGRPSGGNSGF